MIPLPMPQKLRFNITPEVKRDIEKAKQNMNMYVMLCSQNLVFLLLLLLLFGLWCQTFSLTPSFLIFVRMVHDLDVKVLVFSHFGKNVPKKHKLSPDAFVQMALQLAYFRWEVRSLERGGDVPWDADSECTAWYTFFFFFFQSRIYNICCSTYESASLRMFKYGRTDAIRSTTADSLEFVQAMQDPAKQVLVKMMESHKRCNI